MYLNCRWIQLVCIICGATNQLIAGKVCRGTENGLAHSGTSLNMYNVYKQLYTNCTYVDGNVELTFLDNSSFDLSFLSQIREITGYLLIASVFVERIPLTSLRIIRGRNLFAGADSNKTLYAFYVTKNFDPQRKTTVGLRELQLTSLHEITNGNVLFVDNPRLCFVSTVNWKDILPSPLVFHYNQSEVDSTCELCHESCHSTYDDASHCWGSGPQMCQTYTKVICSQQCDDRCTGLLPKDCCHRACAAGCIGPTNSDCLTCKSFENDGRCEAMCPPEYIYSETELKTIRNPDFKYMYGTLCVKECPDHLIADRGACVRECGSDRKPGKGEDSRKCVDCEGPCPKQCLGTGTEGINAGNIRNFTGCSVVQGSIKILANALEGDSHNSIPRMNVSELSALENVEEVTDFVQIQLKDESFVSLSFLRKLRVIKGLKVAANTGASLEIFDTSLRSLDLNSLVKINTGGIVITNNSNLCYSALNWSSIKTSVAQRVIVKYNKNNSRCELEKEVCSSECSAQGCWGKRDTQCLSCKNVSLYGRCLPSCKALLNIYQSGPTTCKHCHSECQSGCKESNGSDACIACRNVKDELRCVAQCPPEKYPDNDRVCQMCHKNCGVEGCTGPLNGVGPGACNSCAIAEFDENGITCLPVDSECKDGYYKRTLVSPSIKELEGKQGCMRCHPLCETCDEFGLSYCTTCKYYRQDDKCVDKCDDGYYLSTSDNVCRNCDHRCLNCSGPTASECLACKHYAVYPNFGLSGEENLPFNCTEKCPAEAQYTFIEEKKDGSKRTVCVADDGGVKNARIGIIVGVVVGIAVIVAVVVVIYFYCRRKQAVAETEKMKTAARILGVDAETVPLQPSGVEPDRAMLRLAKESELQRGGIIGAGAFGTVYKGWWIPENENVKIPVAIKVLIESSGSEQNRELAEEARIMASVNHKYCVRILAICMTARMMIITQLMPFGCLRNYVQENRVHIGSKVLLNWCTQIARGMEYLESKAIVHRDLAARNILVQRPEHVRITDFGLAKLLNHKQENIFSSGEKMPIKWLALECIQNHVYTHKSDVWSYGVMLWELFTYGSTPYSSVPVRAIPGLLEKGERLPQPSICTIDVFMLMIKCWMLDAASRPTFRELANEFEKMAKDPGRYLVIEGDALLRLPSYNQETETKGFLRMLSCPADEQNQGTQRILTADEYLMPRNQLQASVTQETSFNGDASSASGAPLSQAPTDQCNRRSRRGRNPFRRSSASNDGRTSQRYISDPCKQPMLNQEKLARQTSAVATPAPVTTVPEIDPFARQASVLDKRNGSGVEVLMDGDDQDNTDNVWVMNNNFTPVGSPVHRGPPSTSSATAHAVINRDNEYLQPQAHYKQPAYLDVTDDRHNSDFVDEDIHSNSEHAPLNYVEMAQQASPAGVVSNPEYFDDDAFDTGTPFLPSIQNGGLPTSPLTYVGYSELPGNRHPNDRLGSGGSRDYYNSMDSDSGVGSMSQPVRGRDRLSSRV